MLSYYGYTISPNQIETGEGFLICRNVPIARIGDMQYLASELGLPGMDVITVHRSQEEVFSEAALASFEGKPVTDDHPPELLTLETATSYERGHAQNIRKGEGEWKDYVLADLHIHDGGLIRSVQDGKREISCGYECEYEANGDGTYSQKNIRGNHIAVVHRGRAGKKAAILDSDTMTQAIQPERKKMKKKGLFFKLFGMSVKDKSPEEIEQMAMDAAEALEEEEKKKTGTEPEKPAKDSTVKTEDSDLEAMVENVVKRMVMDLKKAQEEENTLDAAIKKLEGEEEGDDKEEEEEKEAKVVLAEDNKRKKCPMDSAVAAKILKAVRPSIAAIKDEKQRKDVADALIACVTDADLGSDITKIVDTAKKNAKKVEDKNVSMDFDAIQAAYDARNPHKNKNGGKTE